MGKIIGRNLEQALLKEAIDNDKWEALTEILGGGMVS